MDIWPKLERRNTKDPWYLIHREGSQDLKHHVQQKMLCSRSPNSLFVLEIICSLLPMYMHIACRNYNLVPKVFVPLDERTWEQPFWKKNRGNNQIFQIRFHSAVCIYGARMTWLLPELSFSDRWSRGTKTLGTRSQTLILPPLPGEDYNNDSKDRNKLYWFLMINFSLMTIKHVHC